MKTKSQISRTSNLESIPDKNQIKLIDNLTFSFTNELGKKKVQDIHEFNKENQPYFDSKAKLTRSERKATSLWQKTNTSVFQFFNLPNRVVWDEFQTDIRNQSNRNTCSGFAMVAAIEARYLRTYGLRLDLSEQFFWHCYKSSSLSYPKKYKYENQSSFWGGGNSQGVKHAVNFAIPLEQFCPYQSGSGMHAIRNQIPEAGELIWKSEPAENMVTQDEVDAFEYSPLYISDSARQKAKYGIESYRLFEPSEMRDTENLEQLIAWGNEVIVDASLKWKTNSTTGIREFDPNSGGASHVFLVVGYDRNERAFYIKNSWGESGFIRVSYEFAQNCFGHGSIVTSVTHPEKPNPKARALGKWYMNHDGWKGELIIRRFTNENNNLTRLGAYKDSNGQIRCINGSHIHNNRGIHFYLTNGEETDPTEQTGQPFFIDVYGWDVSQAAGYTKWQNTPFGAYLSRKVFQSKYGKNFKPDKWKGTWSMNHDGWKGNLQISQVIAIPLIGWVVKGEYRPTNGAPIAIIGIIGSQHPHIFRFDINFSIDNNQPFVLHFHTWSSDLASGYTTWNTGRFGVVAFKK